jgi:hypothetical protein
MPFDCSIDRDNALNRRSHHIVARITPGMVLSAVIPLLNHVYDSGYRYDQGEPRLHPPKPIPSEEPR